MNELNAQVSQIAREEKEGEDDDEEDHPASASHCMFHHNSGVAVLTDFQLRNCIRTTKLYLVNHAALACVAFTVLTRVVQH